MVIWSARARRDRDNHHARIARSCGPAAANAWLSDILRTLDLIEQFPEARLIRNSRGDRDQPVLGHNYVIRYRYSKRAQRIRVVRLFHGKQDRP